MNILVLTNSIGGLHSFRKEVMKAIVDEGYDVHISYPNEDRRQEYFESIGCKMHFMPFNRRGTNPLKDLKLVKEYVALIKKVKPIAVLTYTIKPNVYGGIAAAWCGVPQIANVTGLGDAVENPGLLQKITITLYRLGLRKASIVFFQNSTNRKICIEYGIAKAERTDLLPGSGVNTAHHSLQEYPADGIIKFLFIARLLKDKGTEEYFEMARVLKAKYPNTEFQILGSSEGMYDNELKEMVDKGVINFLGRTNDVRPYIGAVHCTVLPSYHEGLSNVNLESAANGRPVITTNVPGCKETVDDGVTGLLCEAKSVESLTGVVEKFINLPYVEKKQMGIAGRKKVAREFDRRIVIDKYLEVIKKL